MERNEVIVQSLEKRIKELLATPGLSITEIAQILDVSSTYLKTTFPRGKQAPIIEFNVQQFINDEAGKLQPIRLPETIISSSQVITPPDVLDRVVAPGNGLGMEPKEYIPRTRYLVDVLTSLNLPYSIVTGQNTPEMTRQESYQIFLVPSQEKVVFVNNEQGNATFVVHRVKDQAEWVQLSERGKRELKSGELNHEVSVLKWTGKVDVWKQEISNFLKTVPETSEKKIFQRPKNETEALEQLEQAFEKWRALPTSQQGPRGVFNARWLRKNGYDNLYFWTIDNVSLVNLLARTTKQELKESFVSQKKNFSRTEVIAELEQAFEKWQSLPSDKRGQFNGNWLRGNGFDIVYIWARNENVLLTDLVKESKIEPLKVSFAKQEQKLNRTFDGAVIELEEAFALWQSLSVDKQGAFNGRWLEKNGYYGLNQWVRKNNFSIADLVEKSRVEVLKSVFVKPKKRRSH